jgi:hypothetical protein
MTSRRRSHARHALPLAACALIGLGCTADDARPGAGAGTVDVVATDGVTTDQITLDGVRLDVRRDPG